MRFILAFFLIVAPAVTQAAKLTVYNLGASVLVVDGVLTFAPGVTAMRLDVLNSTAVAGLNGHFAADGNFSGFAVDSTHDAFVLADGAGVQDFGVSTLSYAEVFMTGFSFFFVMGLLGTAMRWVRKCIAGGFEEGD